MNFFARLNETIVPLVARGDVEAGWRAWSVPFLIFLQLILNLCVLPQTCQCDLTSFTSSQIS